MANFQQYYKCALCGNIVEVVHEGGGELVCCGQPMNMLKENSVDASNEKHVPVIEKTEKGIIVKVGSIDHPMEEKHYIEWIEVTNGAWTQKKFLKPGEKPQAEFCVPFSDKLVAKEFCNIHGLWKNK
jgi:superoxide reductase